jgi:YD repeat-containing protein
MLCGKTPNSPNWQVTTYTYDYDAGITSITDPIGDTSYYEYDNLHRLKKVVDAQGNVISEHDYNFKP